MTFNKMCIREYKKIISKYNQLIFNVMFKLSHEAFLSVFINQ